MINRADRPVSGYAIKPGDVTTGGRLYRDADTADADGSVLIMPESGWHSQIPPEAVEICYDGCLPPFTPPRPTRLLDKLRVTDLLDILYQLSP